MASNKNQKKRVFSIDRTSDNVFVQFPRPKRSTVITTVLILLLVIVLLIAVSEPEMRAKALELVISIIEAIVTFFSASPKSK
jgi:hypothetical protein